MKIRQIRFRNINSFYGEHPPIQFTEGVLGQTGLFIISGATGAGKSTLLDVITLALFNRIPRISDSDGRALSKDKLVSEGLIVNKQAANEPKAAAYAEVEYELKDRAYRSRWSITKNRNGNWNDYEMEVAELPDGKLISARKSDVPGINAEQIGLSYEQFIRSMVLAQGAFDKFLKASAGERSKLLEQITGTDIYRRLSQRAHVQSREFDERVRDKQREMALIRLLPDEKIAELTTQRSDIEARLKAVEKDLKFHQDEVKWVDEGLAADGELARLDQKQAELAAKQAAFAPKAARLARHEQVVDLATLLADLSNAETNRSRALTDEQETIGKLAAIRSAIETQIDRARDLTQQPTLTEQNVDAELTAFRERVLELTRAIATERDRAAQPIQSIRSAIETAAHEWFRQLDHTDIDQTARLVAARRHEIGVQLVRLEDDYPAMTPDRLEREIEHYVQQATQLSALIELQKQQQERLTEGMELKKRVDEKQAFVEEHSPALRQLTEELEELEEQRRVVEQRSHQLAKETNLEKLREELTAGQPCPLCGSVEHPYTQHYIQQAGTIHLQLQFLNDDIKTKKSARDQLNNQIIAAEAERSQLDKQRLALRKTFSDYKAKITDQLAIVTSEPDLQPEALGDMLRLADVQRRELALLQSLWEQEKTLDRLANDIETVQEGVARVQELTDAKVALYIGDNIKERSAELLAQLNRLNTDLSAQQGLLNQVRTALAGAGAQIGELMDQLTPLLAERGLADVASARACLLDTQTLRTIQEEQRALANESLGLSLRRKQEEDRRKAAAEARKTDLTPEAVRQLVKELEKEQRQKIEQLGNVKAQVTGNDKEQKRQAKLAKELVELEAEAMPWRELNRLIGSAKGDEYSRFAQGLTLAQLIGLANRRLRDLSDRYLLLKPREGQDELYVVDMYQGGAERTVTSLSGGETFTLSLALALALSDLASQNVQIDSLFVDEGFGTLDPETLDTAIVMLEKLQQESQKTIGIISHRHEIKERISVQVQVEKGNDGNSKIKITY